MKVAAAIAEILKREGVEILFGYPVNPLFEAAAAADIRTVVVRQERTGLHMADALSRTSSGRRIGVFTMQHGPGAENAFGGVAQAYGDSVPLLVLAAGYPRAQAGVAPNFSAARSYASVTKSCEQVTLGSAVPGALRRAFAQLRNGRPRPVAVEIPIDVFGEEVREPLAYRPALVARSAPDPADVSRVAELLRRAEQPVLYAGQGVHYARAWSELRELAELLNAPVTTSLQGKSAFPEDHPLSLGSGGRAIPQPVFEFLRDADLIFGIGCSFASTPYGVAIPRDKTIVHATLDPDDLGRDLPADHALLGDAALTLRALLAELKGNEGDLASERGRRVPARIRESREAWLARWRPRLDSDAVPLSPYRVIRDLIASVDAESCVITHDAGSPRDQLSPFWVSPSPLSYIGWGKTTQLGYGLGLAMGAKLARPEKLCINVWGDAAIGMTGMDFETAVRERIPILSILLNNFCMAIELPLMPISTEKYRATDISGNYAEFARALGGYGERVTRPGEILPALRRGIASTEQGVPALLEFITQQETAISAPPF